MMTVNCLFHLQNSYMLSSVLSELIKWHIPNLILEMNAIHIIT